jgi:uncharacterized membrane protein|tara:strand:+ start:889 stop:1368 length:480 start_codon:yes stop_codon:yes gene_type:complete
MNYDHLVIARVIHILGVVLWIGGVAFITTVLIPSISKTQDPEDRLKLFESLEGRFGIQAKLTTLLTGLSGAYMLQVMDAWSRYLSLQFWWLHLMTLVWVIFSLVLFVLEPLVLHKWFHEHAIRDSARAFSILQVVHIVLLGLSLSAIAGAMGGAHGNSS